ncbi:unnamed protein product, partial [Ectocarpus sp. 12 AP-2014]
ADHLFRHNSPLRLSPPAAFCHRGASERERDRYCCSCAAAHTHTSSRLFLLPASSADHERAREQTRTGCSCSRPRSQPLPKAPMTAELGVGIQTRSSIRATAAAALAGPLLRTSSSSTSRLLEGARRPRRPHPGSNSSSKFSPRGRAPHPPPCLAGGILPLP